MAVLPSKSPQKIQNHTLKTTHQITRGLIIKLVSIVTHAQARLLVCPFCAGAPPTHPPPRRWLVLRLVGVRAGRASAVKAVVLTSGRPLFGAGLLSGIRFGADVPKPGFCPLAPSAVPRGPVGRGLNLFFFGHGLRPNQNQGFGQAHVIIHSPSRLYLISANLAN